jgi:hypothetical protein
MARNPMSPAEVRAANQRADTEASRRFDAERRENLRPFQAKADAAFNELGLGAAPRRRAGESPVAYKRQVIEEALGAVAHLPTLSSRWYGFDPQVIQNEAAADAFANIVLPDAVKAMNATGPGSGPERCIEQRDDSGRTIRKFAGDFDPWAPFKPAFIKVVTDWGGVGTGRNAPGAVVPVETLMSDGSVRRAR